MFNNVPEREDRVRDVLKKEDGFRENVFDKSERRPKQYESYSMPYVQESFKIGVHSLQLIRYANNKYHLQKQPHHLLQKTNRLRLLLR